MKYLATVKDSQVDATVDFSVVASTSRGLAASLIAISEYYASEDKYIDPIMRAKEIACEFAKMPEDELNDYMCSQIQDSCANLLYVQEWGQGKILMDKISTENPVTFTLPD